jgi:hypothetical protein
MKNVHCDKKYQQAYSPPSVTPITPLLQSESPSISSSSIIPKAESSKHTTFIINTDILKSMTKQLRKPDGNNIRKIPRRVDMKIPSKDKNNDEQKIALSSSAPSHQESSVMSLAPPAPSITLVAPESHIDPLALSELPLLSLVATKSLIEPLALQPPPSYNID